MIRVIVALFAGALTLAVVSGADASTPGVIDLVAVDVDPTGNEPNGPLGPIDSCREVTPGEVFTIDVVIDSVSPADGLLAFGFLLRYSAGLELMSYAFEEGMIGQDPDSFLISLTEDLPDLDGILLVGVADFAQPPADESGEGVLLSLEVRQEGPSNGYIEIIQFDLVNTSLQELGVESVSNGTIVADGTCVDTGVDPDVDGVCSRGLSSPDCTGADNCPAVSNPDQPDTDGDGDGDACDQCPTVPKFGDLDGDGDGVFSACDNCSGSPTADQTDSDGDGVGDECDFLDMAIDNVACPQSVQVDEPFVCTVGLTIENEMPSEILAHIYLLLYVESFPNVCLRKDLSTPEQALTLGQSEVRQLSFEFELTCPHGGIVFVDLSVHASVPGVSYAATVRQDLDDTLSIEVIGPTIEPTPTLPPVTLPSGTPGPTVPGGKGGDAPTTATPSPSATSTPLASADSSAGGGGLLTATPAAFPVTGSHIEGSGRSFGLIASLLILLGASGALAARRRR